MLKFLKLLFFYLILSIFIYFPSIVHASDFKTDYQVEYDLSQSNDSLNSLVNFKIKITNLKSDVYVDKFAISFPTSFSINNLKASDDNGYINPTVTSDGQKTKVALEFSNPAIGKDTSNNFFLSFNQSNLFKNNGDIWEVVLPVIENSQDETYQVTVDLPDSTNKKISIAKPKPDQVTGNKIVWRNPQTKTIYAVFGDKQIYQAALTYHLKNDQIYPIYTEVAFPPETAHQKIFIQSINPAPESVRRDEDGNYLGKYFLKPLETKIIAYQSAIEIYASPRQESEAVVRTAIEQQKNYLLTAKQYWQISQVDPLKNISTPAGVYNFVTNTLQYDYNKVNSQNKRLGADYIMTHPNQAVCLEFSDLFVAIAREKGIYSREIEGFGFSLDPKLQPLSLSSDILHAWPEYFDPVTQNWVSVDPTWENTSGIDYLTSFDLNHIVFAIHGQTPDYPLPAGMYKTDNSHDVSIKPTTDQPVEKKEVTIENINFPTTISDKNIYQGSMTIKNSGNSYLWNIPVDISGNSLTFNKKDYAIPVLAPMETKTIAFSYRSIVDNKRLEGSLIVSVMDKPLITQAINIIPYLYTLIIRIFAVIIGLSVLFLIYRFLSNLKRHDH